MPFDEGKVGLFGFFPVFLEGELRFFTTGKDECAGGIAVETVDDEDAFVGFVIPFFDVVIERSVGGAAAIAPGSHSQEACRFINDDDVAVLVDDVQAHGLMLLPRSFLFVIGHGAALSGFRNRERER